MFTLISKVTQNVSVAINGRRKDTLGIVRLAFQYAKARRTLLSFAYLSISIFFQRLRACTISHKSNI